MRIVNYDDDDDEDGATIFDSEPHKEADDQTATSPDAKIEESKDAADSDKNMAALNPALRKRLINKYALFEQYLSFLDKKSGEETHLNPVLLGYWCNLFKSLVQTHTREVFIYVYEH